MQLPQRILTDENAQPGGHYSHGTAWGQLVFVAGQLPIRRDGSHSYKDRFEDQVRQALANVIATLRAAGSSVAQVLKVTAYIVGVEHWASFDQIYSELFADGMAARTVVPVATLHHGYLVEVDAVAVRDSK